MVTTTVMAMATITFTIANQYLSQAFVPDRRVPPAHQAVKRPFRIIAGFDPGGEVPWPATRLISPPLSGQKPPGGGRGKVGTTRAPEPPETGVAMRKTQPLAGVLPPRQSEAERTFQRCVSPVALLDPRQNVRAEPVERGPAVRRRDALAFECGTNLRLGVCQHLRRSDGVPLNRSEVEIFHRNALRRKASLPDQGENAYVARAHRDLRGF